MISPNVKSKTNNFDEVLNNSCNSSIAFEDIPTLESFRSWFEDNFLTVTDRDLAFYIVRWISKQPDSPEQEALFRKFSRLSVENTIDTMWPELAENAN